MKKPLAELLTSPIRVAVLGSGAREHALAAKLAASPLCRGLVVLPGNEGMRFAGLQTEAVDLKDHAALAARLKELKIELTVVGPDDLLAAGVVDELEAQGLAVFGPRKAAARIEWSKAFAKELMTEANIPTARHAVVGAGDVERIPALAAELGGFPVVLKYDGLALGKGVRICVDERDASEFAREIFEDQKFAAKGKSAPKAVLEQFLSGHEVSLFALTDGQGYVMLEPACDHKRLGDGNIGPNTGGMGAYSPVPWLSREHAREMAERIFPPLLERLREAKAPFRGLLYAGLMVKGRDFWVLEYNARFGDPETQAILPRLDSDLLPLLYGVATENLGRNLDANPLRWSEQACVNVVAASRGYPELPETGFAITGLEGAGSEPGCRIFYAGVKAREGGLMTSGGRVLGVSALGPSLELARSLALGAIEKLHFDGMRFRRDIGSVRSNY